MTSRLNIANSESMDHVDRILAQWREERPDLEVAPMGLIGRVKRLNAILVRGMEKTWAEFGLNAASFDRLDHGDIRHDDEPDRSTAKDRAG